MTNKLNTRTRVLFQIAEQFVQEQTSQTRIQKPTSCKNVQFCKLQFANCHFQRQTQLLPLNKQTNVQQIMGYNSRDQRAKIWEKQLVEKKVFTFKIDKQRQSLLIQSFISNQKFIIYGTFLESHMQCNQISSYLCEIYDQKLNKRNIFHYSFDPIEAKKIKFSKKYCNFKDLKAKLQPFLMKLLQQLEQQFQTILRVQHLLNETKNVKFKKKQTKNYKDLSKDVYEIYCLDKIKKLDKIKEKQRKNNQIVFENVQIIQQSETGNLSSGGYFNVKKSNVRMKHQNISNNQQIELEVAVKQLKQERKRHIFGEINPIYAKKIEKQKKILKNIKNSKHFLQYYYTNNPENQFASKCYMQLVKYDLYTYLRFNKFFSLIDLLQISKQILQAVKDLHDSEIVHRDLKPSNFLVKQSQNGIQIKLIDFSESVYIPEFQNRSDFSDLSREQFGYTLPYSPIQCSQFKKANKQSKTFSYNGICAKQIDYWSIGIILFELFESKSALNYFKPYYEDYIKVWGKQFCLSLNRIKQKGIKSVLQTVRLVFSKMVKINQSQRTSIQATSQIFDKTETYLQQILIDKPNINDISNLKIK